MEETIDGLSATVKTFSSLPMSKETQLQDLEKKLFIAKGSSETLKQVVHKCFDEKQWNHALALLKGRANDLTKSESTRMLIDPQAVLSPAAPNVPHLRLDPCLGKLFVASLFLLSKWEELEKALDALDSFW